MPVQTEAPKYSPELIDATEATLRHHDLRCKVGIGIEQVLDTLVANGVTPEVQHGYLSASMNGIPAHLNKVVEGLATQRTELFYPRDPSGITAKDQLDTAGKIKLLSTKEGLALWESLPQTAPKCSTVVLDRNRLTKSEYLSLPRTTRAELSGQWGPDAIGKILARK